MTGSCRSFGFGRMHLLPVLAAFGIAAAAPISAWALSPADGNLGANEEPQVAAPASAADLTRLGDQYREGNGVAQDLARAAAYYAQASELGDAKAMMRYGEALVLGQGVAADTAKGAELLRKSADMGNASAALALGDIYAQGSLGDGERPQALGMYEKAAALGRDLALLKLAKAYADGVIVPADPGKAVAYYRKAIEAGRKDAMAALGNGLVQRRFGSLGTRAEGLALLQEAYRLGHGDAVVSIADCYFNGYGVARDPAKAVKLLTDAWNKGNARAGLRLLSLYRDGRKNAVPRDRFLADYYFRRVSHVLDKDELQMESVLLKASRTSAPADLAGIGRDFGVIGPKYRPIAIRKMRITNPNAYVYLVQSKLKDLKVFDGGATGVLTRRTARAIHQYCLSKLTANACRKGPMTGDVAQAISAAF